MNRYQVVCEKIVIDFENNVNRRLEEGYKLYGNPFITEEEINGQKTQYYNQVLIID